MDPSQILDRAYAEYGHKLKSFLEQGYPTLKRENLVDDVVQTVFSELLEALKGGMRVEGSLSSWLKQRAKWRATDLLRQRELLLFQELAGGEDAEEASTPLDPTGREPPPDRGVLESERRTRQGLALSQILSEFASECERLPAGYLRKTIYERALRGESPQAIAESLRLKRNTVDQHLKRARDWIVARIKQKDVNRSVFRTFFAGSSTSPPPSPAIPSGGPQLGQASKAVGASPPTGRSGWTFEAVVRWVIEEMGALCPSSERLAAYLANPQSPEFIDVQYHVRQAGCCICNAEIGKDVA